MMMMMMIFCAWHQKTHPELLVLILSCGINTCLDTQ